MNKKAIKEKAKFLIDIIKNKFITKDGFLSRDYPPKERTLFDNFDDIVPFFLYFNEQDFLLNQIKLINKHNQNLLTLCSDKGIIITRNLDEWFGGLYLLWEKTKDNDIYQLLTDSINFVKINLIKDNNLYAAFYIEKNKPVKYYESWASGILETFCEMRDEFPEMFKISIEIMKKWINNEYFKKYGLFPYRCYLNPIINFFQKRIFSYKKSSSIGKKSPIFNKGIINSFKNSINLTRFILSNGWYSQLMKSNSTPAFTLLELYNITKDDIWKTNLEKCIINALLKFTYNNLVFEEYIPKRDQKLYPGTAFGFILIDVICDSAYFIPELKYFLPKVKDIIDNLLNNRLNNGLIPLNKKNKIAHIDNQVDFAISMRRYSELSNDKRYLNYSIELIEKTLNEYYTPNGYTTFSGEIKENKIDPKYNALLLKGMINLLTIDESLYPKYYSLFKDR